jgi:hypothetical protein
LLRKRDDEAAGELCADAIDNERSAVRVASVGK